MSQPRASPAIGSQVPSFVCVTLKERGNIICFFQSYEITVASNVTLRVRHWPAGPFLPFICEKSARLRRDPGS